MRRSLGIAFLCGALAAQAGLKDGDEFAVSLWFAPEEIREGAVAYGFASAIGFLFAIVLFAGVRMRLSLAEPPRAFSGLPLVLVTAGLIAMAFSGFSGIRFA